MQALLLLLLPPDLLLSGPEPPGPGACHPARLGKARPSLVAARHGPICSHRSARMDGPNPIMLACSSNFRRSAVFFKFLPL